MADFSPTCQAEGSVGFSLMSVRGGNALHLF